MAKWGEGDPRWIVEERVDGTNVNNWHWTEKNAFAWSKAKLTDLLVNLSVEGDVGSARISEVDTISGEATASNRKGKIILFYEIFVKLKWKGKTCDGDGCNGTLSLPNLSEENDPDEVDVDVSLAGDSPSQAKRKVKDLIRKQMTPLIHEKLEKWLNELKTGYCSNMVKDSDLDKKKKAVSNGKPAKAHEGVKIHSEPSESFNKKEIRNASVSSFKIAESFECRPQELFQAMMDEQRVSAFTQSLCKVDAKVGGSFSLFGGAVTGTIKDLVPFTTIVEAWRFSNWTQGHHSTVTIAIAETNDGCRMELTHSNVPVTDLERTKDGWMRNYFHRMKGMLGFGVGIGGL